MVRMRPGTKYSTTVTKLRCTRTTLASVTRSLLSIGLFITARNFTASLSRGIPLAAIDQLRSDNLMENRHIRSNPEHLLAQFELFQGLSGLIIHRSRGHFALPHILKSIRSPILKGCMGTGMHLFPNHEQAAIGTRNRALHHQQITLRISLNYLQLLRCYP